MILNEEQEKVFNFLVTFDLARRVSPGWPLRKDAKQRIAHIREELKELIEADKACNLIRVADALTDLLYVVYGAFCVYGLNATPLFNEVHRSNMTKIGGHKDKNGKWIKPNSYDPPKLASIINTQILQEIHKI